MIRITASLLFFLLCHISCSGRESQNENGRLESISIRKTDRTAKPINHFEYISSVELPAELDFCGERVPLEIPEVRERAEREFYLLLQQPGQIMLYLKRSGRYFPMYERILKETGLPDDLKYLSVAESALYMARSSKNAIGLWQFMARTAKVMGLRVDGLVDERRHPEKSTRAALKYLEQGYKEHGSWILAAGGYNMGHTNIIKSMKRQSGDDYFDLFLNSETSRFVFRIVMIKELMKDAEKYGFVLGNKDYYRMPKNKIITVSKAIKNLSDWARSVGTTYKDVKLLNPWILKRSLKKPKRGRPYEIAIPEYPE